MEKELTSLEGNLRSFLKQKGYPCIGAKAALHKDQIFMCYADDILSAECDEHILESIYGVIRFFQENEAMYTSFAVVFSGPDNLSEAAFELAVWQRLQALHNLDSEKFSWDARVSNNADEPNFSFSLGGKAFFVIGMNPNSSRKARQFETPAMIFNLHEQFERLREAGSFESIREQIRKNDLRFAGSFNPNIDDYGRSSEARQYSGKAVDENWLCPLKVRSK